MLRANQAVRLGLRAASRNPELAFWKALLDQLGNLLAVLPVLLAAAFLFGIADSKSLFAALAAARALRWPTAGALLATASLAFAAGAMFWAGALPLLAADVEMDRRPPGGNFALLASRGFARVLFAALTAQALSLGFSLACAAALFAATPAILLHRSRALFAGAAWVAAIAVVGSVLLDLLGKLVLLRAAAFAEGVTAAFGKAAALLAARLGSCLVVSLAFVFLELIAAAVVGGLTGVLSTGALFDPDAELLAIAPRIAIGLAAAAVFAWLEVARMGALSAIALDAEGLIETPPEPQPPEAVLIAEPVIEALPVDGE